MAALNRVVLAGGTGFLGKALCEYFRHSAREIVVLSRKTHKPHYNVRYAQWDGKTVDGWAAELEGADLLVNLAGKNVNCRYTDANMRAIYASRLEPTVALGRAIAAAQHPPASWIQLASATIYRHAEDRAQDELTGELGSGFSVDVCKTWEASFRDSATPATKKVLLRVGIVLGPDEGAFPRLVNLVRLGFGGPQGDGRQMMSWLHVHDLCRIIEWAHQNAADGDIYNATSPGPLPNAQLMQTLRTLYGIPFGLPSPQWLLELGSRIIGTEVVLILKSRWVIPKRLLDRGFQFQFADAHAALADILWRRV
jgi:uncharacterized protein (TIGR01777 family)